MFWKPNCHCILMTARLTCFTILGLFKMPNLARPFVNVHYAISWSSLYWGRGVQIRNCREMTNNEWPSKIAVGKSMMTNNNFCHKKILKMDIFAIFSLQKSNTILLSAVFWQKNLYFLSFSAANQNIRKSASIIKCNNWVWKFWGQN